MLRRAFIAVGVCAALMALATGCGRKLTANLGIGNQPPSVQMTVAPPEFGGDSALRRVSWIGTDPDGRVDHYLVARDPRDMDRVDDTWRAVLATEQSVHARRAMPLGLAGGPVGHRLQVLAVRAVDDQGAVSAPVWRAFWDQNVAPTVTIVSPRPSRFLLTYVGTSFRVTWKGTDPDGPNPTHLVKYKFKLLEDNNQEFPLSVALRTGGLDSLRRFYAPAFAGWDSVPGDTLTHFFKALDIGHDYLFVITGFDVAGDYDPVFSFDSNVLRLRVTGAPPSPRLTLANPWFSHVQMYGEAPSDSQTAVPLDAPAGQVVPMSWSAEPAVSAAGVMFRWAVDIASVFDEAPRHSEKNDLNHWSAWSATATSIELEPEHGANANLDRRLYVEAQDDIGSTSLEVVQIHYVRSSYNRELLIVDDTRRVPDIVRPFYPDTIRYPTGPWPNAAELDTFLFARGGVPWRKYPAGTLSSAGLFAGYDFDTIGTRTGAVDNAPPLELLGRYRHVLWIVDEVAPTFREPPSSPGTPMCALRWMSEPGHENTLAAYIRGGGQVWLLGGGAATATLIDQTSYGHSATGDIPLPPGSMMYDLVHWRSAFSIEPVTAEFASTSSPALPGAPATLERRSAATDPIPPLRNSTSFYPSHVTTEYLSQPNSILEPLHGGSEGARPLASVLDTLYRTQDAEQRPCMTLYRGQENAPVVFSGFDIWSFPRAQCLQLVDAVLQGYWGLARGITVSGAGNGPHRKPTRVAARR